MYQKMWMLQEMEPVWEELQVLEVFQLHPTQRLC